MMPRFETPNDSDEEIIAERRDSEAVIQKYTETLSTKMIFFNV